MVSYTYSNKDFFELMEVNNPLHLRDEVSGRFKYFPNHVSAYDAWLKYLHDLFPRGYLEFLYYFRVVIGLNSLDCVSFFNVCKQRHGAQPVFLVDWEHLGDDDLDLLVCFTKSVQLYYGTTFVLGYFKVSFSHFCLS